MSNDELVPRRADGAPAKLWWGPNYQATRAAYGLDPGALVGFLFQPLPGQYTGRPVDQPERMYLFGLYSYLTGEIIYQVDVRREHIVILRDAMQEALDQPLSEAKDADD